MTLQYKSRKETPKVRHHVWRAEICTALILSVCPSRSARTITMYPNVSRRYWDLWVIIHRHGGKNYTVFWLVVKLCKQICELQGWKFNKINDSQKTAEKFFLFFSPVCIGDQSQHICSWQINSICSLYSAHRQCEMTLHRLWCVVTIPVSDWLQRLKICHHK